MVLGVGKTSIGKSIARALNKDYFRFSVGGLTDISELKGHRRTYVGAMPGKIVQALKKVKSNNPLILIDEVDKIGKSHTGDPASVLLEVLDPEQNSSFLDHYLDVPLDLSKTLFVCTANILDTIPGPLLDRMEIINLSGYVSDEKVEIANRHLIPKLLIENGLNSSQIQFTNSALQHLLKNYCRESGVRNLKRYLEKVSRVVAFLIVKSELTSVTLDEKNLKTFAGQPIYTSDRLFDSDILPKGVVTGLAWTSNGGSTLYIESIIEGTHSTSGHAKITKTGQLGNVMQESSAIAYSFAKSFMFTKHPDNRFFDMHSIHLHIPEGATPKDGPSAGVTMALSLLSLACNKPISSKIAMTGELTLSGKILRIGGVREKVIAAKRSGIETVILPASNQADWDDLPASVKSDISPRFLETFEEIAAYVGL